MCAGLVQFLASENNIFLHVIYLTWDRRLLANGTHHAGGLACLSPYCLIEHLSTCNAGWIPKWLTGPGRCKMKEDQHMGSLNEEISRELVERLMKTVISNWDRGVGVAQEMQSGAEELVRTTVSL